MSGIRGIRRLDETTIRFGGVGDDWYTTWADNDKQYVSLCDGHGWADVPGYDGTNYNARAFAINGTPPDVTFEHLPGYPDLPSIKPREINRYYNFGILALDGAIYQYLSTPNHVFAEPEPRFVGAKLIYSPDNGRTWKNQDSSPVCWEPWDDRSSENMVFFYEPDDAFSQICILQMGRNYEHNTDGFVYVYAPNGNTEGTMNQVVMFRVARDRILDRSSYEFFAGPATDGAAAWSRDIADRAPVHTFPSGGVNTKVHPFAWSPSVAYNAPLGAYMMSSWGMGCAPDGMWFDTPSYLGFWVADWPWGPWRQVHEETAWTPDNDPHARAYQPQIIPKWIADDGKSFWMVWSDFQVIDGKRPYYAFNAQKVTILVD